MPPRRSETGQASVELVALLPLMAVLAAMGWQAVVAGHAVWSAGTAARAAARAVAIGGDPAAAARRTVAVSLRSGLRVRRDDDGAVTVLLRVPRLGSSRSSLTTVSRSARFVGGG